ncbi:uncharacterized protein BDZ99DRAFT_179797 [Mytilinidion resinicola]|uniref:Uncharacterized protein n=1 Tax=Mytilinidion resinicola TaxID=574789 RepID=A0A6A6Z2W3_9PEZI|nr:uncharacterized protein BDZ99DRAFT_179797 [Mytilinidion resinicola]KAF2814525.1 hypothetical protein BDZ99DRAFT_179797 [Mytilinidion resinicola]
MRKIVVHGAYAVEVVTECHHHSASAPVRAYSLNLIICLLNLFSSHSNSVSLLLTSIPLSKCSNHTPLPEMPMLLAIFSCYMSIALYLQLRILRFSKPVQVMSVRWSENTVGEP